MDFDDGALLTILLTFFIVFSIIFIIGIIIFIFQAIGLFRIAKRGEQADVAWLAWVPIANTFLLTMVVEKSIHEGIRGKLTMIYAITFIGGIILASFIPFLSILSAVVMFYAFFFLAKRYSTNPMLHLIIGIITLGMSTGISIFMFRNNDVVDPTGIDVPTTTEF